MAKHKRICIWGASVTWGAWDYEMGVWVARLRKYLDDTKPAFVYNLGVSGANTNDILERFEVEAKARRPDIVLFSLGTNDASYKEPGQNSVSLAQFVDNINQLVVLARKFTDTIIFLGISHVDETKSMPRMPDKGKYYDNTTTRAYAEAIQKLCTQEHIFFLDIFDLFGSEDTPDGIHPNAQGHEKIYLKVRDFLLEKKLI